MEREEDLIVCLRLYDEKSRAKLAKKFDVQLEPRPPPLKVTWIPSLA